MARCSENLGVLGSSASVTQLTGNSTHQQTTRPLCHSAAILPFPADAVIPASVLSLTQATCSFSKPRASTLTTQTQVEFLSSQNSDVVRPLVKALRSLVLLAESEGCPSSHEANSAFRQWLSLPKVFQPHRPPWGLLKMAGSHTLSSPTCLPQSQQMLRYYPYYPGENSPCRPVSVP